MKHHATDQFWKLYHALPAAVRDLADKNFLLLKNDPHHPSLHLKKIGRFWSARIGLRHRVLAFAVEDTLVWFWIGTHAEYDQMVDR